ncbi:hypothetical protein VCEC0012_003112A, partial [Vibrio cholerae O1 str. EC-0012]
MVETQWAGVRVN